VESCASTGAVEITEHQYERIADSLPRQRGNVSMTNLQVLNALLYVTEQDCKWRDLPKHFGNWHTVYTRMNRWSKAGVLDRVFARLQAEQILAIRIEGAAPRSRRRNEIERFFRRLEAYRRVFSRFDKLDVLFVGFIVFALIFEALRFSVRFASAVIYLGGSGFHVNEDAALLNRPVTLMTPAALFSRHLQNSYRASFWVFASAYFTTDACVGNKCILFRNSFIMVFGFRFRLFSVAIISCFLRMLE